MRKQLVDKDHYLPLTPSLTERKIRNFQEILDKRSIAETQFLAGVISGECRLKIIFLLGIRSTLCVNDIADILKSKVSGVSHQLAILRKVGLVKTHKKRKIVYYSLKDKLPSFVESALKNCDV